MKKIIFYLLLIIIGQSCLIKKQFNSIDGVWIPVDVSWEIFIQDTDSTYFSSFDILVIDNKEFAIIGTTNATSTKKDSIKFNVEPGYFLRRGNIQRHKHDSLLIQYEIDDERIIKLSDSDTVIPNRIYKDVILIENRNTSILKYGNLNYRKTNILYKESFNRVYSFIKE